MSRIDELIAIHCPNGVEFVPLAGLLDYQQPSKFLVKSVAYDDSFTTPVLTAGQTFVLGYTDESVGVYPASTDSPVVIFDDFTTAFKWVDFPFKAKSSAMKILTPKPGVDLRFVWFAMQTIPYIPQDHARQWIGTYSQFRIPVPPLEVQREIVRILDTFSKMEAELEAELEARKQQYEHYRSELVEHKDAPVFSVGEIVKSISSGRNKSRIDGGLFPVYGSTGQIGTTDEASYFGDALLVARVGANAGRVNAVSGEYDVSDNTLIVTPTETWDVRFAFHQLTRMNLNQYAVGGGQPLVTGKLLKSLKIHLPSLAEQRRVAAALDKFDALVNDLSVGLPAELAARRQQYEYYRDKLLTFKELEPAS